MPIPDVTFDSPLWIDKSDYSLKNLIAAGNRVCIVELLWIAKSRRSCMWKTRKEEEDQPLNALLGQQSPGTTAIPGREGRSVDSKTDNFRADVAHIGKSVVSKENSRAARTSTSTAKWRAALISAGIA